MIKQLIDDLMPQMWGTHAHTERGVTHVFVLDVSRLLGDVSPEVTAAVRQTGQVWFDRSGIGHHKAVWEAADDLRGRFIGHPDEAMARDVIAIWEMAQNVRAYTEEDVIRAFRPGWPFAA